MASFGHSGKQAPQLIHSAVISSAMILVSLFSKIEKIEQGPHVLLIFFSVALP